MTTLRSFALTAAILSVVSLSSAQEKRDFSTGNTLYLVPYSHLDTQWRWSYPQVIREYIWNTMADNLKLIDKYPSYVFNFSGSRRYEMMREYYPDEYQKVVAAIKAGRWFPCGSSVDENDANVPSGESMIRHVLYGNNYFRKNFGIASNEFMLPDCFGFPYALPTILTHCGITGFSTQKLTWGSAVGVPFTVGSWIGPDGSSVIAALNPGAYVGDVKEDLSQNTSWLARIQKTGKQSGAYVDYHYYGTGDRGGAPGEKSVEMAELSTKGKGPIKVLSTRADEMFMSITPEQKAKLPKYDGELLLTEHSAGSITSQAHMKRWNRKNELLADVAERASVAANLWAGKAYPADRIYTNWDLVLGSQMHDMLPGTSLPKAYEYCYNDELLALNGFAHIATDAVGAIAARMDTRAMGTALVVQNPLSIAREDVVETWLHVPANRIVQVVGPDGKPVPTQVIGQKDGKTGVLFLAKIPANGFAAFDVQFLTQAGATKSTLSVKGRVIESPRFRVTINEAGDIASIYDKVNKKEALKAPAGFDFQYHNPAAFPAWNMDWTDAQKPPIGHIDGPAGIKIVENGPVRCSIEVTREARGSKFVQRISLAAGGAGDRVEVFNKIDWQSREVALKAAFPVTTGNPKATYDIQTGAIVRGNNDPKKYEVPQHQWFDLSSPDGKYGVAILNDSKFGSDKPTDDTVRLTLLYTPGVRGGYEDEAVQDFGRHEILYAIAPHAGDWRQGDVAWAAKRLNQPLRAFTAPSHSGALGKTQSLASASTKQVEIQAIKRAEDGDGFIVRLRELTGKPASNVLVKMSHRIVSATEVDGQERPLRKALAKDGAVVASVKGFGLASYRVRVATNRMLIPQPVSMPVNLPYDLDVASTDKNDRDGAFDAQGRSYSADMLPKSLNVGGIQFKLGPTNDGAKNAVAAKGQSIAIPAGYDRIYLLAASTVDTMPTFKIGNTQISFPVPAWDGYVGQWDTRLWAGVQPELAYNWSLPYAGLEPGYVKKAEVAWYASHRHIPGKGNGHYEYTYLFKHAFDIPKGAKSLTLPNDPRVRIFAVSVAKGTTDATYPAAPLYDTLDDHRPDGGPNIVVPKAEPGEGVNVTIEPPLYWNATTLRYTTDGSTPNASSPLYTGPIFVGKPTLIKVADVPAGGQATMVVETRVTAVDSNSPKVTEANLVRNLGVATVTFSEPVDRTMAEQTGSYTITGSDARVTSANLGSDQRTVALSFDKAIPTGATFSMNVKATDRTGNLGEILPTFKDGGPTFTAPALAPSKAQPFSSEMSRSGKAPWTINLWVKADKQPEPRTLIGGFGSARDGNAGVGRYLAVFADGIRFWSAQRDVTTSTPLEVGRWQMLTATYDGTTVRVYKDGKLIGSGEQSLGDDGNRVQIMPLDAWDRKRMLEGEVKEFTLWNQALPTEAIVRLHATTKG